MHCGQMIVLLAIVCAIQLCSAHANHVHNHHSSHGVQHSTNWLRTEVLDGNGLFVLDWRKSGKDIVFRATVNTRGYIGLGFSYKSEKIGDADIMLAWVDDQTGEPNVLVSACKLLHSMWRMRIVWTDIRLYIEYVDPLLWIACESISCLREKQTENVPRSDALKIRAALLVLSDGCECLQATPEVAHFALSHSEVAATISIAPRPIAHHLYPVCDACYYYYIQFVPFHHVYRLT